jgi:hypothetical protein
MSSPNPTLSVVARFLTVVMLVLATFGSSAGAQESHLSGTVNIHGIWRTSNYQCPAGVHHTEEIRIVQHGESVVATKITGDDCVRAGHVTFAGTLHGTSGEVSIYTSYPGVTPTLQRNCTVLKIVSLTKIEETGACFTEGILVFRKVS